MDTFMTVWRINVATLQEAMYRFLVLIEEGEHNYSAYVPDLPGCVATGRTREEVEKNMREAHRFTSKGYDRR